MIDCTWQSPAPYKADGQFRRVGIEIEFGALNLPEVTNIAARWAGSEACLDSVAEGHVQTRWGKLSTEIDWSYMKKAAADEDIGPAKEKWLERLENAVNTLVPMEVVLPPIPLNELDQLEPLVIALRQAGARGTHSSALAAFGLHLNPELPNLDADTLIGFIQAFGLLQWWMAEAYRVDFSRRLSPYIDLYSESYVLLTLQYNEYTVLEHVRQDFFEHNPTRNRALDLWPLFAHLDGTWVKQHVPDQKIKPRPTLHFRLPNCDIDEPGWQLKDTWRPWYAVECLAHDRALRDELAQQFVERNRPVLGVKRSDWVEHVKQWLKDRSLA